MRKKEHEILIVLPMAYRDGIDKYSGINRYLRRCREPIHTELVRETMEADELVAHLESKSVDAILGDTAAFTGKAMKVLAQARKPTVLFNPPADWSAAHIHKRVAYLQHDNADIGRCAAQFLKHQNAFASFAFVNDRRMRPWSLAREKAFVRTLEESGRAAAVYRPGMPERTFNPETRERLRRWLLALPKPAAVFASHDIRASEILSLAGHAGLKCPKDIAVLGVDNDTLICEGTNPPLSSVFPDCVAAGAAAIDLLLKLMHGESVPLLTQIPVKEMIERRSTATQSPAGNLVAEALKIIKEEACEIRTVPEIARRLKVSRRLLDLRFRQITGTTIVNALMAERLAHVKELLESSALSIDEIARRTHFNTPTYLMRLYKARYGHRMSDERR